MVKYGCSLIFGITGIAIFLTCYEYANELIGVIEKERGNKKTKEPPDDTKWILTWNADDHGEKVRT